MVNSVTNLDFSGGTNRLDDGKEPQTSQTSHRGSFFEYDNIDYLVGKLLTYIDATYADREQREAQKSIVKSLVRQWYYDQECRFPVNREDTHDDEAMEWMYVYTDARPMSLEEYKKGEDVRKRK